MDAPEDRAIRLDVEMVEDVTEQDYVYFIFPELVTQQVALAVIHHVE